MIGVYRSAFISFVVVNNAAVFLYPAAYTDKCNIAFSRNGGRYGRTLLFGRCGKGCGWSSGYNNPVPSQKQAGRDKGGVEILATPLERERKRWIIRLAHGTEGISSRSTRDPLRSARTRTSLCSRATCSRRSTRASATTSRRTCISAERS